MMGDLAQYNQRVKTGFQNPRLSLIPKISSEAEIKRPEGYALPGFVALSVTAEAEGLTATGYGEGPRDLARGKAISEAFERLALFKFCADSKIRETSNGWAAHRSADLAIRAATLELIERDVALNSWEDGGPFYVVPESLWPMPLSIWKAEPRPRLEFFDLRILLSQGNNGACISALLFNEKENFVAGHASAFRLEDAILSAANECFRAAHSAIQFEFLAEVTALHAGGPGTCASPGAHSLAYAYKETMPEVVRIVSATENEVRSHWERHQIVLNDVNLSEFDTKTFEVDDRIVARVKSPRHRQIFWGRTNDLSKRNKHPHFVG
ncbi:MAG: YcaO-like family protein [Bacteriovoracia bacterium]